MENLNTMINIFKLNEVEVIFSYNIVQQISDLTTNLESILIHQKYFKPKLESNINADTKCIWTLNI